MGASKDPVCSEAAYRYHACWIARLRKNNDCCKACVSFKKQGRKPLLVAADTWRPAAIKQLLVLGEKIGVEVFSAEEGEDPVEVASKGVDRGKFLGCDTVIVDTRGRLHVDDDLMAELGSMQKVIMPQEVLSRGGRYDRSGCS